MKIDIKASGGVIINDNPKLSSVTWDAYLEFCNWLEEIVEDMPAHDRRIFKEASYALWGAWFNENTK